MRWIQWFTLENVQNRNTIFSIDKCSWLASHNFGQTGQNSRLSKNTSDKWAHPACWRVNKSKHELSMAFTFFSDKQRLWSHMGSTVIWAHTGVTDMKSNVYMVTASHRGAIGSALHVKIISLFTTDTFCRAGLRLPEPGHLKVSPLKKRLF